VVQSLDHHAAFFAAASAAYAVAVVASIVRAASAVAVTGVVVAASVGTSWVLVVVSSGGFPFEKQDVVVASAFSAVASVVVVASVAVVVPFVVASAVASFVLVVLAVAAASFLVAAAAAAVASLGCPVGAALVVLVLGIEAGFECHLEGGSLAWMLDLAFSASEGSLDSLQLQRNLVGLELPLPKRSQALAVLAAWPQWQDGQLSLQTLMLAKSLLLLGLKLPWVVDS